MQEIAFALFNFRFLSFKNILITSMFALQSSWFVNTNAINSKIAQFEQRLQWRAFNVDFSLLYMRSSSRSYFIIFSHFASFTLKRELTFILCRSWFFFPWDIKNCYRITYAIADFTGFVMKTKMLLSKNYIISLRQNIFISNALNNFGKIPE